MLNNIGNTYVGDDIFGEIKGNVRRRDANTVIDRQYVYLIPIIFRYIYEYYNNM